MIDRQQTILIVGPRLANAGGVANFYQCVLPLLRADSVNRLSLEYLEVGATVGRSRFLGPIIDQSVLHRELGRDRDIALVHVNPSLNLKCSIRDGLFVWQAKRMGLPVIVFFRGWDPEFAQFVKRRFLPWFRATLFRADAMIALGSVFEEELRSWGYRGPIFRSTTVVNDDVIDMTRLDSGSETVGTSLLFLSRLERAKGIFEVLEATRILRERGYVVKLTVAGDGAARSEVEQWITDHPELASQINMAGFVTGQKKLDLLASHDIFVLPTYREGLPNAILEAMAAGLVIITCDVGAIAEVIKEKENGFFVKQGAALQIAETVEKLINNPNDIAEISRKNRVMAAKKYSTKAVTDGLWRVYESFLTDG